MIDLERGRRTLRILSMAVEIPSFARVTILFAGNSRRDRCDDETVGHKLRAENPWIDNIINCKFHLRSSHARGEMRGCIELLLRTYEISQLTMKIFSHP